METRCAVAHDPCQPQTPAGPAGLLRAWRTPPTLDPRPSTRAVTAKEPAPMSVTVPPSLTPAPQGVALGEAAPAAVPPLQGVRRGVAEAARYGILRRLAPALKHDMVVHLQSVSMMAEVLDARLDKGAPPVAELQRRVGEINRLAREAVAACLKVTDWIQPGGDDAVRLSDGVAECVALQQSSLNFRGFLLRNEVAEGGFEVSRVALRNLLAASLVTLTDAAPEPCVILLQAEISAGFARLSVRRVAGGDPSRVLADLASQRHLDWADVQALAQSEGVELVRSDDLITLLLPRLVPSSPLQLAPL